MWDRIAAVVLFAAFAADCAVLTLRNVHMLQLNSYRPERYGRWMKAHRPELWRTYGWLPVSYTHLSHLWTGCQPFSKYRWYRAGDGGLAASKSFWILDGCSHRHPAAAGLFHSLPVVAGIVPALSLIHI